MFPLVSLSFMEIQTRMCWFYAPECFGGNEEERNVRILCLALRKRRKLECQLKPNQWVKPFLARMCVAIPAETQTHIETQINLGNSCSTGNLFWCVCLALGGFVWLPGLLGVTWVSAVLRGVSLGLLGCSNVASGLLGCMCLICCP